MSRSNGLISFLSDFGSADGYTGIVKGVILKINPQAHVIDITHDIKPWAVSDAAWVLANSYAHFPQGTVHLAVVDPAVGSDEKRILLTDGSYFFVGPDSGIFSAILKKRDVSAFHLTNPKFMSQDVSTSFHARDIFAPVAAHLSAGVNPSSMGEKIDPRALKRLTQKPLKKTADSVEGSIVYIDRFGNLITDIAACDLVLPATCFVGSIEIGPVLTTYASVEVGQALAFIGSHGFIEIACNKTSACQALNAATGFSVSLKLTRSN
ncbi:MAG: SAM-dependent chlorinase/fluorinase [Candidatus Obscuribacterales bacterium]|nr:SAM-dependent chlorinase/fluorinase [Candidatus Obscuribacterales bacterium]